MCRGGGGGWLDVGRCADDGNGRERIYVCADDRASDRVNASSALAFSASKRKVTRTRKKKEYSRASAGIGLNVSYEESRDEKYSRRFAFRANRKFSIRLGYDKRTGLPGCLRSYRRESAISLNAGMISSPWTSLG